MIISNTGDSRRMARKGSIRSVPDLNQTLYNTTLVLLLVVFVILSFFYLMEGHFQDLDRAFLDTPRVRKPFFTFLDLFSC